MPAESSHQIAISSPFRPPKATRWKTAETTPNKLRKNLKGGGEEKERTKTSNPEV